MSAEKGDREEQSREERLENQRHSFKSPNWKSRVVPRDLGEKTGGNMGNVKRWKNVQSGM